MLQPGFLSPYASSSPIPRNETAARHSRPPHVPPSRWGPNHAPTAAASQPMRSCLAYRETRRQRDTADPLKHRPRDGAQPCSNPAASHAVRRRLLYPRNETPARQRSPPQAPPSRWNPITTSRTGRSRPSPRRATLAAESKLPRRNAPWTHPSRATPARWPTATSRWNWSGSPRPPPSPPRAGSAWARRTRPTAPRWRRCAGVRHRRDRRHRGDRRGRDGRGADAVYRREGRRRRPADGHRGRSAGGHHADRQGRPQRASPPSRWRSTATSCTRPTSTWTRSPSAAACRTAWWTSTRRWRATCATWRRPRSATSPTWSPASSTATATRS